MVTAKVERFRRRLREVHDRPELLLDFMRDLAHDPSPIFDDVLDRLGSVAAVVPNSHQIRKLITIVFSDAAVADLRISAALRKRDGYSITVSRGFFSLLGDLVEIHTGVTGVVSKSGDLISAGEFTRETLQRLLKKAISNYFLNPGHRWHPQDELRESYQERFQRELEWPIEYRRDFIHLTSLFLAVMFVVAHELGHVVSGHFRQPLFHWRRKSSEYEELEADSDAAKFVIDYISVPPSRWEPRWESSGNPLSDMILNGLRVREAEQQYLHGDFLEWLAISTSFFLGRVELPVSQYQVVRSLALNIVAAVFNLYEAMERASQALARPYSTNYPSAAERYQNFRATCIKRLSIPETAFTMPLGLRSSPDEEYRRFNEVIAGISWD